MTQLSGRQILLWIMLALALWTAQDFLLPLAFGVVLAVALWPLNQRWGGSTGSLRARLWVPLGLTLATCLVFVLPLTVLIIEGAYQGQALLHWLAETQSRSMPPPEWLGTVPLVGNRAVGLWRVYLEQPGALSSSVTGSALATAGQWILALGSGIAGRSLLLLVSLMALFFILRDGEALHARAKRLAEHQLGPFGRRFLNELVLAVRGTVGGTIAVAIGEGVLIGLGYVVTGVPHAMFLALLTTAFALLPFGAWAVFSVAAAVLAINGDPFAAALLFGYGAVIMVLGDNFVTPLLVGARVELPLLFAFVGAFGGLAAFGIVGIFVGPVIMAGLLIVLREFWPGEAVGPPASVAGEVD
jgi:predicted PurR-regulated permease PerM